MFADMVERSKNGVARSQTLSRGIRVLEVLAGAERPLSIDEVAAELGVHRSIVYRIVRTLEDHRLVARDPAGRCAPEPGWPCWRTASRGTCRASRCPNSPPWRRICR